MKSEHSDTAKMGNAVMLMIEAAEETAARLRRAAEEYPLDPAEENVAVPPERHWGTFPGQTRVCFTKEISSLGPVYHLSVSAPYGRVSDLFALALLKLFRAPLEKVSEIPPVTNPIVRHFYWSKEERGQRNLH